MSFLQLMITALLVASIIFSFSIIKARNKWKRLVAYSLVSVKVIMIIVLYALMTETTFFLDVAVVYALLSYIGIIVIANYMLEWRRPK
ncbi:MAG: monovalent cation/H+ antiporter complex subunit F [Defluviitaleaceae bacterium]|nr:monovalent cation/H+ antiporter complex subunit F [Defluviitaleaceae bacterium]